MSIYKNPNQVVEFLYNEGNFGPTHDAERDCIRFNNADHYLRLEDNVWSMTTTASGNNKITRAEFDELIHPTCEVIGTEYGPAYEFLLQCPNAGLRQLVSVDGYARLIAP